MRSRPKRLENTISFPVEGITGDLSWNILEGTSGRRVQKNTRRHEKDCFCYLKTGAGYHSHILSGKRNKSGCEPGRFGSPGSTGCFYGQTQQKLRKRQYLRVLSFCLPFFLPFYQYQTLTEKSGSKIRRGFPLHTNR